MSEWFPDRAPPRDPRTCGCGGTSFRVDSDAMTGSVYAVCLACNAWWPVGQTWIDRALGVGGVFHASWWSRQLSVRIEREGW